MGRFAIALAAVHALPLLGVFCMPLLSHNSSLGTEDIQRLGKRVSAKKPFSFCSPKIDVIGIKFPSSGDLIKDGANVKTFQPLNWADDRDYSFGISQAKPDSKNSKYYGAEHILEWQVLTGEKGFLGTLAQIQDTKTKKTYGDGQYDNPIRAGGLDSAKATGLSKVKDLAGAQQLSFCQYLSVWWGKWGPDERKVLIQGIKDFPINILPNLIPNQDHFTSELVLLDFQTNGMKQYIWGPQYNHIRSDETMEAYLANPATVIKAIDAVKHTALAIEYMIQKDVKQLFQTQLDRIADAFDGIEAELTRMHEPQKRVHYPWLDPQKGYQRLELGKQFKVWVKVHSERSYKKGSAFVGKWSKRIVAEHAGDVASSPRPGTSSSNKPTKKPGPVTPPSGSRPGTPKTPDAPKKNPLDKGKLPDVPTSPTKGYFNSHDWEGVYTPEELPPFRTPFDPTSRFTRYPGNSSPAGSRPGSTTSSDTSTKPSGGGSSPAGSRPGSAGSGSSTKKQGLIDKMKGKLKLGGKKEEKAGSSSTPPATPSKSDSGKGKKTLTILPKKKKGGKRGVSSSLGARLLRRARKGASSASGSSSSKPSSSSQGKANKLQKPKPAPAQQKPAPQKSAPAAAPAGPSAGQASKKGGQRKLADDLTIEDLANAMSANLDIKWFAKIELGWKSYYS